jgi:hypothetical protein
MKDDGSCFPLVRPRTVKVACRRGPDAARRHYSRSAPRFPPGPMTGLSLQLSPAPRDRRTAGRTPTSGRPSAVSPYSKVWIWSRSISWNMTPKARPSSEMPACLGASGFLTCKSILSSSLAAICDGIVKSCQADLRATSSAKLHSQRFTPLTEIAIPCGCPLTKNGVRQTRTRREPAGLGSTRKDSSAAGPMSKPR